MRGSQYCRAADRHEVRITTRAGPEGSALIEISDTGPGVSEEARAHLFEPYFSTKPPGIGTGLGLYVCLEIAQEHRGSVALVTRPAPGAIFRVELPERAPDLG